jgi:phenazine biosynthesis protein phzE
MAADPPPFAVLHRPHIGPDTVEILFGELTHVPLVVDLPEPRSGDLPVLAVVPFRQIRERGFDAVDDGVPLLALRADERVLISLADLVDLLPDGPQTFTETGYDVPDIEYEQIVRTVLDDEIAAGAGSNFVLHRCLTGRLDPVTEPPARAALGVLKRLLLGERRAYWTFVVHTPMSTFVGATPERHVSLDAGIARMNPISGTLRYPVSGYADRAAHRAAVLAFLADPKERDELAMVVDEELKMMAVVGDRGGRVRGPYLKEMAHLAHTEYVIEGRTSFDARQVLAATMFAPTVTGSPIRNACRVIARHEQRGRRYYAGVLALLGQDSDGPTLDSPILIRTAEIASDGSVRVAAGATLVRGSKPESELAETRAKAAAIVQALLPTPPPTNPAVIMHSGGSASALTESPVLSEPGRGFVHDHRGFGADREVLAVLAERNRTLARFWLQEQGSTQRASESRHEREQSRGSEPREAQDQSQGDEDPGSQGRITVINAEDDFTGMLAHLLSTLGFEVDVQPWTALTGPDAVALTTAELVVLGPGPGDPTDLSDPRILALHQLAKARLAAGAPILGVCLGHQILSVALGLRTERLPTPDQGRQIEIDLFGSVHRVGFYNSYIVRIPDGPTPALAFSADPTGRQVQAIRGERVTGLQFHPESVLTTAGVEILGVELTRLCNPESRSRD